MKTEDWKSDLLSKKIKTWTGEDQLSGLELIGPANNLAADSNEKTNRYCYNTDLWDSGTLHTLVTIRFI